MAGFLLDSVKTPLIMKQFLLFLILTIVATSCKTNLVYIKALNPPQVSIPSSVKHVGIINRSVPSEDNKALNNVHQVTSAQTVAMIRESGQEEMRGLNEALIEHQRFDIVKSIQKPDLRTPVSGSFPSPLSWKEVETICKDNGVDVLFVLEVFDTQLRVVPLTAPAKVNTINDVINNVANAQADIITTVKTGWRLYDPSAKVLIDEFPQTNEMGVRANAATAVNTVEAMLGRKEAIKQSANGMGRAYANRFIPYRVTLTRDYYVKGTRNMKIATRRARTGNWDGAGELWLRDTQSGKRKIAGRACYNMAILGEINGDLDGAIKWAQKSYEDYNNKLALQYVNQLKYRRQLNPVQTN